MPLEYVDDKEYTVRPDTSIARRGTDSYKVILMTRVATDHEEDIATAVTEAAARMIANALNEANNL